MHPGHHTPRLNTHEAGGALGHGDNLPAFRVVLSGALSPSNPTLRAIVGMEPACLFVAARGMDRLQGTDQDGSGLPNRFKASQPRHVGQV